MQKIENQTNQPDCRLIVWVYYLKGKKMYTSSYQYEMEYNPEGYAFNLISYENIGGKNDNIK